MTSEYQCPDCGAALNKLYERAEQTPTKVIGWCTESGESKSVPKHGQSENTEKEQ